MITQLTVSNFRSIGEAVTVDLGQLTVFVGPNGSGKSNVLDALRFLSDAVHMGLSGAVTHRNGIGGVRRWSAGHPYNTRIGVRVRLPDGTGASYAFELTGSSADEYRVKSEDALVGGHRLLIEGGRVIHAPEGLRPSVDEQTLALTLIGGDPRFSPLVKILRDLVVYAIFPDTLRAPQKYNPSKPMSRHGENWLSILKDQPKDTWHGELVAALRKLIGDVVDLRVTTAAGYLVTQFRHDSPAKKKGSPQKWFDGAHESDGTLRVAGILTALLQQPAVPVIGIEEPELTVHPGALPLLCDFLKQASDRSQVLVTTHSPELLDHIEPEDVRIVERAEAGTTVTPLASEQREFVKQRLMSLGELQRLGQLRMY